MVKRYTRYCARLKGNPSQNHSLLAMGTVRRTQLARARTAGAADSRPVVVVVAVLVVAMVMVAVQRIHGHKNLSSTTSVWLVMTLLLLTITPSSRVVKLHQVWRVRVGKKRSVVVVALHIDRYGIQSILESLAAAQGRGSLLALVVPIHKRRRLRVLAISRPLRHGQRWLTTSCSCKGLRAIVLESLEGGSVFSGADGLPVISVLLLDLLDVQSSLGILGLLWWRLVLGGYIDQVNTDGDSDDQDGRHDTDNNATFGGIHDPDGIFFFGGAVVTHRVEGLGLQTLRKSSGADTARFAVSRGWTLPTDSKDLIWGGRFIPKSNGRSKAELTLPIVVEVQSRVIVGCSDGGVGVVQTVERGDVDRSTFELEDRDVGLANWVVVLVIEGVGDLFGCSGLGDD